jgi:ribonuclease P protein component
VGLVVGRVVGGAVVRNRTRRRLREALARRAPALPAGCALVVRARPESAALSYAALDADLGRALDRALGRVGG